MGSSSEIAKVTSGRVSDPLRPRFLKSLLAIAYGRWSSYERESTWRFDCALKV